MSGTRILITGGSGWIGRHVAAILHNRGAEVHATYNRTIVSDVACHWHQVNLLNHEETAALIRQIKPTHLVHLAWEAVPPQCYHSLTNYDWVPASMDLIQRFVENGGTHVVVAGTCAEYEWVNGYLSESDTPLSYKTPYALCKNILRTWLQSYSEQVGLRTCWSRIFHLYGPHESGKRFVSSVIASLWNNEQLLCTHGNQNRDFLHITDAAEALVALVETRIEGVVNIGSGQPVPLKQIASIISEKIGSKDLIQWGSIPYSQEEPLFFGADIARITSETHWKPRYSLQAGLEHTVKWWLRNRESNN